MPNTLNTKSQQTKATFSKLVNQSNQVNQQRKSMARVALSETLQKGHMIQDVRAVKWETLGFVTTFSIHISGEKTLLIL